jgi:hypothetical protein
MTPIVSSLQATEYLAFRGHLTNLEADPYWWLICHTTDTYVGEEILISNGLEQIHKVVETSPVKKWVMWPIEDRLIQSNAPFFPLILRGDMLKPIEGLEHFYNYVKLSRYIRGQTSVLTQQRWVTGKRRVSNIRNDPNPYQAVESFIPLEELLPTKIGPLPTLDRFKIPYENASKYL